MLRGSRMRESHEHAVIVELFRETPELALQLLRRVSGAPSGDESCRVVDPVLRPGMLLPDLVIELRDPRRPTRPSMIIVVEVQRRIDPEKLWSWPGYVWLLRLKYRCPVQLLVIAPDAAVAAWAAQPILCGPECVTRAQVVGPGQIPGITEVEHAVAEPKLAPLAGRVHGGPHETNAIVQVALTILDALCGSGSSDMKQRHGREQAEGNERVTEDPMLLTEWADRIMKESPLIQQALRDGLRERSRAEGMQDSILRVLARRGVTLSPEQEADIRKTYGIDELEYWIDRAVTANSAEELFAEPMD